MNPIALQTDQLAQMSVDGATPAVLDSSQPSNLPNEVWLDYPHDFLHPKTGAGPRNPDEAVFLWKYRKNRPISASDVDREPPDGARMMREVKDIQDSLKSHVIMCFLKDAKSLALSWQLKMPGNGMAPMVLRDFGAALGALKLAEGSLESETLVYMVCHHFHHQRQWLSDTVDAWLVNEKMRLLMPENGEDKTKIVDGRLVQARVSPLGRGGFGAFARNVKAEIVKRLMRNMLTSAGWCIATKDNSKQDQQGKRYELITIQLKSTLTTHNCYRVTLVSDAEKGKEKQSKKRESLELQDAVDWGTYLCRHFGVTVEEPSVIHDLWYSYKQLPPAVSMKQPTISSSTPAMETDISQKQVSSSDAPPAAAVGTQVAVNSSGAPPHPAAAAAATQPPLNNTAAKSVAASVVNNSSATTAEKQVNSSGAPPHPAAAAAAATQPPVNNTAAQSDAASVVNNSTATTAEKQVNSSGAHPPAAAAPVTQPPLNSTAAQSVAASVVNNSTAPPVEKQVNSSGAPHRPAAAAQPPVNNTAAQSVAAPETQPPLNSTAFQSFFSQNDVSNSGAPHASGAFTAQSSTGTAAGSNIMTANLQQPASSKGVSKDAATHKPPASVY